jgi:FAD binding domain
MGDLSRRSLLKVTAAAGAGAAVLPCAAAGSAAGVAASASGSTSGASTAKSPPAQLTGRIVRPQHPGYASASLGWDELFVHYPLVIVFAQETQDVVNALSWARQNNVALRVRSGRHQLEGWSNVDNGIVIDISELKSARIDAASLTATVGAGLSQLEAVTSLAKQDLAVTTGSEGSVGLSGATLGGGFGFVQQPGPALGAAGRRKRQLRDRHLTDLQGGPAKSVAYVQATWEGLSDLNGIFNAWQRTAPFASNRSQASSRSINLRSC